MKPRHNRLRRALKWACTAACLAIVAAWVVSTWCRVSWDWIERPIYCGIMLDGGAVVAWHGVISHNAFVMPDPGPFPGRTRIDPGLSQTRWRFEYERDWNWSPYVDVWLQVPLWAPLLLLGGLRAWAWRRERRHPPGSCPRCGYDRAGLEAATPCPECGRGSAA